MSWKLFCFREDDEVLDNPTTVCFLYDLENLLLTLQDMKVNPNSMPCFKLIRVFHNESLRVFNFDNLDQAIEKVKLLGTFS